MKYNNYPEERKGNNTKRKGKGNKKHDINIKREFDIDKYMEVPGVIGARVQAKGNIEVDIDFLGIELILDLEF